MPFLSSFQRNSFGATRDIENLKGKTVQLYAECEICNSLSGLCNSYECKRVHLHVYLCWYLKNFIYAIYLLHFSNHCVDPYRFCHSYCYLAQKGSRAYY
jgi:hypothetical protein